LPCIPATIRKSLPEGRFDAEGLGLETVLDTLPQVVWSARPDGHHDFYNQRWYDLTGVAPGSTDGAGWSELFHPDDRAEAWARWRHSLATGEPYEVAYRLRHKNGEYRWNLGRALAIRDREGRIERWFGTCTDIHDLKVAEEQRELVTRELSHRIKNIFAVVSALVALSARSDPAAARFAENVRARIDALARAHEHVRPHSPHSEGHSRGRTVHGLIAALLEAYETPARRISWSGDDPPVEVHAATALALVIHELATNAVKYGALSTESGEVVITTYLSEGRYTLKWTERGGPPITAVPSRQGFGRLMSERAARAQLGAEIVHDWQPGGLMLTIEMPLHALTR
jgi:PAS domain S-box-containing protein